MTMDDRRDPVEILARVGGVLPADVHRAYEVWIDKARKAGWEVTEEPGFQPVPAGTECGQVSIEGLPYRVHYGLGVRRTLLDDASGAPAWRSVLGYAAWAEPNVDGYRLD